MNQITTDHSSHCDLECVLRGLKASKESFFTLLLQDSEIFINDKKTGTVDTFWNPTPDLRQSRLTRCTVPPEEQGDLESERWT